ncbi:4-(cytidine 5'-diphospho)-2-C-methyl-D-erythritol kinase [Candidatus Acetothermia bacterium]|jgi:4-diphosphocytidyl-2-C-methyl-D-erythritol kinase|nr:4-(cytidine 5'-diphospho)-2-C-methyl-D-erythritol kinase [Candidatus Acetothermia bacterium]MCI2427576.1 4-(cytidine 5'-diphospho)-2-C-methyl-D-erythritol kinase [Candidatus Acetothermia bacterium]MCI2428187.1 4-(cytidine 5'-diphospho)-2-C-methyl-D-erythritol kinase [Candidatus Acetothermia bacterium]
MTEEETGLLTIDAYAKLNFALRVINRDADGYHEIESLVQTIDLADTIKLCVTQSPNGQLSGSLIKVDNELVASQQDDLAYKAAQAILAAKESDVAVQISIKKRIPIGAGLGGGSSDGAAVLLGLDRLIAPRLLPDELLAIAAKLGSDLPLFLFGGLMLIRGRGERVTPLPPLFTQTILLVVPPFSCDTTRVYQRYDQQRASKSLLGNRSLGAVVPGRGSDNDLEAAALDLYPQLNPYREVVAKLGSDLYGMSGSGSSFYVAFSSYQRAKRSTEQVKADLPHATTYLCRPVVTGMKFTRGIR